MRKQRIARCDRCHKPLRSDAHRSEVWDAWFCSTECYERFCRGAADAHDLRKRLLEADPFSCDLELRDEPIYKGG